MIFREVCRNFAQETAGGLPFKNFRSMRNPRFILIVVIVALLIDLYVFQAIKAISQGMPTRWRTILYGLHWGLSALAVAAFIAGPHLHFSNPRVNNYLFAVILGLYIAKLLAGVFMLLDDLRRAVQWIITKLSASSRPT